MKILWNPWRYEYVKKASKNGGECLFCELQKKRDDEAYIVYRGKRGFVVLNAYPYNSGHVMIAPYQHVGSLEELDDETLLELGKLVQLTIKALRKAYSPDGFNIGVNIGKAAGAGVPGHVHIHVVPRWVGDTNFMAIIAETKPLPTALKESFDLITVAFREVLGGK